MCIRDSLGPHGHRVACVRQHLAESSTPCSCTENRYIFTHIKFLPSLVAQLHRHNLVPCYSPRLPVREPVRLLLSRERTAGFRPRLTTHAAVVLSLIHIYQWARNDQRQSFPMPRKSPTLQDCRGTARDNRPKIAAVPHTSLPISHSTIVQLSLIHIYMANRSWVRLRCARRYCRLARKLIGMSLHT